MHTRPSAWGGCSDSWTGITKTSDFVRISAPSWHQEPLLATARLHRFVRFGLWSGTTLSKTVQQVTLEGRQCWGRQMKSWLANMKELTGHSMRVLLTISWMARFVSYSFYPWWSRLVKQHNCSSVSTSQEMRVCVQFGKWYDCHSSVHFPFRVPRIRFAQTEVHLFIMILSVFINVYLLYTFHPRSHSNYSCKKFLHWTAQSHDLIWNVTTKGRKSNSWLLL